MEGASINDLFDQTESARELSLLMTFAPIVAPLLDARAMCEPADGLVTAAGGVHLSSACVHAAVVVRYCATGSDRRQRCGHCHGCRRLGFGQCSALIGALQFDGAFLVSSMVAAAQDGAIYPMALAILALGALVAGIVVHKPVRAMDDVQNPAEFPAMGQPAPNIVYKNFPFESQLEAQALHGFPKLPACSTRRFTMNRFIISAIATALLTGSLGAFAQQGVRDEDKRQGQPQTQTKQDNKQEGNQQRSNRQGQASDAGKSTAAPADHKNNQRSPDSNKQARQNFKKGDSLPLQYRGNNYVVTDWHAHNLKKPGRGQRWVQVNGGDFVLINIASHVIASVILSNAR